MTIKIMENSQQMWFGFALLGIGLLSAIASLSSWMSAGFSLIFMGYAVLVVSTGAFAIDRARQRDTQLLQA